MKQVEIAVAAIVRGGRVLACRRARGRLAGGWEFPGGKLEPGESPEQAVVREVREELAAEVHVLRHLMDVSHDYAGKDLQVQMHCLVCELTGGFRLLEHSEARWLGRAALRSVAWHDANWQVVDALEDSGLVT